MAQCASLAVQVVDLINATWRVIDNPSAQIVPLQLQSCVCASVGFVIGAVSGVALHEISHIATAIALGLLPDEGSAAAAFAGVLRWTVTNAAGLMLYLLGVGGAATGDRCWPHVSLSLPPGVPPDHWRVAVVQHAGWIASALLAALALAVALGPAASAGFYGIAAATIVVLMGALTSDLLGLDPMDPAAAVPGARTAGRRTRGFVSPWAYLSDPAARRGHRGERSMETATAMVTFFCGNIGLLVASAAGSTVDMMSVLRSQVAISSQRGAQSGGLVALVESAPESAASGSTVPAGPGSGRQRAVIDGVRSRCAPGKRDHLSVALHRRFTRALGRAPRLAGGHGIFVGHTRFATSSQPSEGESHPHQWSPPLSTPVWRTSATTGRLEVGEERFGVWITHNGDFDFWRLMGQDRTHSEVAAFLNAALGCPSPAKCDSVRVAGMIELLRTQGLWFASVRLAYYDTVVSCSFADVVASADPSYGASKQDGDGDEDPESNPRSSNSRTRVATRAELQALAVAIEVAFASLIATLDPDSPAALFDPDPLALAGAANGAAGFTAYSQTAVEGGAVVPCRSSYLSIQLAGAHGGGGDFTAPIEISAHGDALHMPYNWDFGGLGSGRPSIAASAPMGADAQPTDATAAASTPTLPPPRQPEDSVGFVLERRPSFEAVAGSSLAGAVLAAQMSAAVQRAALDHSVHGGHEAQEAEAGPRPSGGGMGAVASARRGSLEIRTRILHLSTSNYHLSMYDDPAASAGVSEYGRRTANALAGSGGDTGAGTPELAPQRVSPRAVEDSASVAAAAPTRMFKAAAAVNWPTPAPPTKVAEPGRNSGVTTAPTATAGAATDAGTASAIAAACTGHQGGAAASQHDPVDIPVSYGQEAVRMACALGWGREGSRKALLAALVEATKRHLEATRGWPAWRATVPSLERLISTAVSYFVANDLYTACCRFLKHAKGSFGLAVLCSLEPDRVCLGAWGQPMAMSFSQAQRAVLYGSETACAMIPIASRSGCPVRGGCGGKAPSGSTAMASAPTVAAVDDAIVTHATNQLFEVNRVEERLADTITLNGNTVEVIRDSSRYSTNSIPGCGGAPGYSNNGNYSSYSIAAAITTNGGSCGGGHSTYSVHAGYNGGGASGRVVNGSGGVGGGGGIASPAAGQAMSRPAGSQLGPLGESVERDRAADATVVTTASVTGITPQQQQQGYNKAAVTPLYERGPYGKDEGEAVLVDNGWSPAFATHRIDIDEGSGEMMQLVLTDPCDPGTWAASCATAACATGHSQKWRWRLQASANDNADGWSLFRVLPFVRLRVYQLRTGSEVDSREDFEAQERIVQLVGNPYVIFNPSLNLTPGRDYVADDLADLSRVLSRIRESWTDPLSLNRQTAEDLYQHLDRLVEFAMSSYTGSSPSERPGIDLLITGVEASLWLAEQWAGDLKLVFPQLNVQAVSANKVISVLGNARGRIPPTGSTFCRSSSAYLADHHTLCIAVSQSGQTFPTIHAARILNQLLPGRVYALCGSVDTKMALALGQRVALRSPFTRRVFNSCAGGRCAEPPSVVCVALHQTMSELLSYLVLRMRMTSVCASGRPLGMILTKDDMVDLRSVRDRFIDLSIPQLTGFDASGRPLASEHHSRLVHQGRRWALHVIETPTAWVLSLIHILATVVSGWPVVYAVVHGICLAAGAGHVLDTVLSKVALAVDSVIYMFLPIIYAVLLRAIQRRPLWHRMGKRTIVVADVPYVHQILETFVSKMYALSYGIASVEVHGANPVDHFVHRFTHRVVRGLLIALGRPDGRLYSQTKSESWVLLGLLQAKVITSWGHQPEVVSIGHNPYHPAVVDTHLQLPSNRPRLLIEALEHTSEAVDPNQLWAHRRHMVMSKFPLYEKARELLQEMEGTAGPATGKQPPPRHLASKTAARDGDGDALTLGGGGGKQRADTGGHLARRTSMRLMARRGPCNAYSHLTAADVLNMPADQVWPLLGHDSKHLVGGHLLYGIFRKAELRKMWDKLAVVRQLASVLSTKQVSESVAREAVVAVGSTLEGVLLKQTVMEQLLESRYLSLERLIAFMVMFHAMARRTADWWPLTFDIARSQSGLRVATTAAPVTASELEQSLAETIAGDVVDKAAQRDEMAGRERLRHILSSNIRKRATAVP